MHAPSACMLGSSAITQTPGFAPRRPLRRTRAQLLSHPRPHGPNKETAIDILLLRPLLTTIGWRFVILYISCQVLSPFLATFILLARPSLSVILRYRSIPHTVVMIATPSTPPQHLVDTMSSWYSLFIGKWVNVNLVWLFFNIFAVAFFFLQSLFRFLARQIQLSFDIA
ncbi:hypothetical protein R3P38DRAFT_3291084 [Favolaschia claudopus]|uniref:Uncharacterized protein n=1 Tax=Favolaschia claudopus TaxID=2862362 RepID=A0AAV9ZRC5_9AGAR